MTYKEELKQQCEALSNQELLTVVNNKGRYNEMIVTAAQIELRKRSITEEERKDYKELEKERGKRNITGNITEDLQMIEKIGTYIFFFAPMQFWFFWNYRKRGLLLKQRQLLYFCSAGFAGTSSAVMVRSYLGSSVIPVIVWGLIFVSALLLNQFWFKHRTMRNLAAKHIDYKD